MNSGASLKVWFSFTFMHLLLLFQVFLHITVPVNRSCSQRAQMGQGRLACVIGSCIANTHKDIESLIAIIDVRLRQERRQDNRSCTKKGYTQNSH